MNKRDPLPAGLRDCRLLTLIVLSHAIVAKFEAQLVVGVKRLLLNTLPNAFLDQSLTRCLLLTTASMHRVLNLLDSSTDVFRVVAYTEIKLVFIHGFSIRSFLPIILVQWIGAVDLKNHFQVGVVPGDFDLLDDARAYVDLITLETTVALHGWYSNI